MAQQKFTVKVSKDMDEVTQAALGLDIVDFILDRTESGKDKKNTDFPGYSQSYIDSFDFKAAGKSKGTVNLALSSEMMNSLTVLETNPGEIVIGIPEDDSFNNDKAEGNITGSYGGAPNKAKARDFMGIHIEDLNELKRKYPVKSKADKDKSLALAKTLLVSTTASKELAESFFGKSTVNEFDNGE